MAKIMVFAFIAIVLLIQDVRPDCQDTDKQACSVLKLADAKMCENPCLAKICKGTCGFCPLKCYHCDSVSTPEACTQTVQCPGITDLCIASQRFNDQLSPVFSSGCVNSAVCRTLFNYNATAGKRAYTLHGGCCATDLCNLHDPDNTTTIRRSEDEAELSPREQMLANDVADTDTDQCDEHDKNNVACALLHKSDPKICRDDCIARKICPETCGTCVRCKTCVDVDAPDQCNNITLCKKTESCFSRESLRSDFTLGNDLKCMDDFICHAYFGGIIHLKKRQFGGGIRISGQCCKKNLCNANGIIPVTTPSSG